MAVQVAVVGLGFMGITHYFNYKKVKGAKLIAVCDVDPRRLEGDWRDVAGNLPTVTSGREDLSTLKRYNNVNALVEDPDVDLVDICLPTHLHASTAIKALTAGKHVFVEKPIALSVREADQMIEAANKARRFLMVGQVLRFFPAFRYIKESMDKGDYGRLRALHLRRIISKPTWAEWFLDPKKSGGAIVDLHIHDSDFVQFLLGLPKAVFTVGLVDRKRYGEAEYFVTHYLFDDADLTVTAMGGNIAMPKFTFEHGYDAFFEAATIEYNSRWRPNPVLYTEDGKEKEVRLKETDPYLAELQYAVDCIRKNEPPELLSAESARNALLLCLKEAESLNKGKPVKVAG